MADRKLIEALLEEIDKIELIDTHEHFPAHEKENFEKPVDFAKVFEGYASNDLVSAGMTQKDAELLCDASVPEEKRWKLIKPFWQAIRTTTYGRVPLIIARDLYEIDDINDRTYKRLSEKVKALYKPGLYKKVLRDKAKIEISINDKWITDADREFLAPVQHFHNYVVVRNRETLDLVEKENNVRIHTLDDLEKALEKNFIKCVKEKIVGVKCTQAYLRILRFDKVPKADAERLFNRIFSHLVEGLNWEEAKPLQDYMFHKVVRLAIEHKLPIQIHTGIQAGNANIITNANPAHLINLFLEYSEAKFDIFHAGYPYSSELAVIAKNFPNVYPDMSWMHAIGAYPARRILSEWIDTVPNNKIFGFGGDYSFVEGAYAHSRICRENVAMVLAEKIEENHLSEDEALLIAKNILRDNPGRLFKLLKK